MIHQLQLTSQVMLCWMMMVVSKHITALFVSEHGNQTLVQGPVSPFVSMIQNSISLLLSVNLLNVVPTMSK